MVDCEPLKDRDDQSEIGRYISVQNSINLSERQVKNMELVQHGHSDTRFEPEAF